MYNSSFDQILLRSKPPIISNILISFARIKSHTTIDRPKEENVIVTEAEIGSILSILNEIMDILPNKKIIAWCGTIKLCEEWCNKFNEYKEKLKNIFPEIYKIET